MSERRVAIVGSGIVGTTLAYLLTKRGYEVDVFEKGPEFPYPHSSQFSEQVLYLYDNPAYQLRRDLKSLTLAGDYRPNLDAERVMVVGGSATQWEAITLRMRPADFKRRSLYGYGDDWPIGYDDLEPFYGKAEAFLGVSGTDTDNPFAPKRSSPYPLPPFAFTYDDAILAERLRARDMAIHTTPQARTREVYEQRPACVNFGACYVCPIGARYSPNYHLAQALETGRCRLHTNVSVRRIALDSNGRARAVVLQENDGATQREHAAEVVVVAAGTIESIRLLLLSADDQPTGVLGNVGEHIGQHFVFHHAYRARLHYPDRLFPGRLGAWTGQSHQFLDPAPDRKHGGIKVEFSSHAAGGQVVEWGTGAKIAKQLEPRLHWRNVMFQAESVPTSRKFVTLSAQHDRFGDPYAHVQYASSDFDHETAAGARALFDRFAAASGADQQDPRGFDHYSSGAHHMGGCRMGLTEHDSVVDSFGRLHGSPNLFVLGGSMFVGTSGALNPTLTMVALAIRAADYVADQSL